MENYFAPSMDRRSINAISALGLAHLGDAVFEVMVRSWLCTNGRTLVRNLHRETVAHVCAPAQARRMERMLPLLNEEELACYRRGRNAHSHAAPRAATEAEYHAASGLEALFGWLYLRGQNERIEELFAIILEENNASGRHTADGAAP